MPSTRRSSGWRGYGRSLRHPDGSPEACATALRTSRASTSSGSWVATSITKIIVPWCAEARFTAMSDDVVPQQVKTLTSAGNVSTKKMGVTQYWAIYQTTCAALPTASLARCSRWLRFPVCLVHGAIPLLDTRTGHVGDSIVLSVAFEQSVFETMNFDAIDPVRRRHAFRAPDELPEDQGLSSGRAADTGRFRRRPVGTGVGNAEVVGVLEMTRLDGSFDSRSRRALTSRHSTLA